MAAPTRTPETIDSYRRRAQKLRDRVARLRNLHPDDVLPIHIVEHLMSHIDHPTPVAGDRPIGEIGGEHRTAVATSQAASKHTRDPAANTRHAGGDQAGQADGASRQFADRPAKASPTARRAVFSRATYRQYKAALLADFAAQLDDPQTTRYDAEQLRHAIARLESTSASAFAKRGSATSSLKAKTVADATFDALLEHLDAHAGHHRWAVPLRIWLRATRLVGLRPGEWEHAALRVGGDPGDAALVVRNAKHTNGRANGPTRTLGLQSLPPGDIGAIDEMLQMVDALTVDMSFSDLQRAVAKYMHQVTRALFPPTARRTTWPTLYSFRHQLLADAKLDHNQSEVAAIAGHASDATAGQHYGRRRSGTRTTRITPAPSEVASVRRRAKTFRPAPHPRNK